MGLLRLFHSPTPPHAPKAKEDEGNTKELTHVEEHSILKVDLVFLCVFNKYAGSENKKEAKAKEEACTYLLRLTAIEPPMDEEEYGIAYSLVQLSGVPRD